MSRHHLPVRACPILNGTTDDLGVADHASIQDIFNGGGTIRVWHSQHGAGDINPGLLAKSDFATKGWYLYYADQTSTTGTIVFAHAFGTAIGIWTGGTVYSYNDPTLRLIHVKYDASSPTTAPKLCVNGFEETMAQVIAPSGAFVSDAAIALSIGSLAFTGGIQAWKGHLWGVGLENSVLSAAACLADWQTDNLADTDWQGFWQMQESDYGSGLANTGSGGAGVATASGATPLYCQVWSGKTVPT